MYCIAFPYHHNSNLSCTLQPQLYVLFTGTLYGSGPSNNAPPSPLMPSNLATFFVTCARTSFIQHMDPILLMWPPKIMVFWPSSLHNMSYVFTLCRQPSDIFILRLFFTLSEEVRWEDWAAWARIFKRLRSAIIDSASLWSLTGRYVIGLSWNRFLSSLVNRFGLWPYWSVRLGSESNCHSLFLLFLKLSFRSILVFFFRMNYITQSSSPSPHSRQYNSR
jgi:hypothetical protein